VTGPWNWQAPTANLELGTIRGCVDTSHPSLGVHQLCLGQFALAGSLLGTLILLTDDSTGSPLVPLLDAYVRGNDLVAKYSPTTRGAYRTEIYWTATTGSQLSGMIASISLRISIETDLLATHPEIRIGTELPASDVMFLRCADDSTWSEEPVHATDHVSEVQRNQGAICLLYRFEKIGLSYVEMTHPSDFQSLTIRKREPNRWFGQWQLFGQLLEKGVIRRARIQGLWIRREQDVQAATFAYWAFIQSEIPLSA
jgi:hypothetical protein